MHGVMAGEMTLEVVVAIDAAVTCRTHESF